MAHHSTTPPQEKKTPAGRFTTRGPSAGVNGAEEIKGARPQTPHNRLFQEQHNERGGHETQHTRHAVIHTGGQLDRALQLRLLQAIASSYPHKHFLGLLPWEGADEADAYANLHYLCAHGLIEGIVDWDNNGRLYMAEVFVATKDGMDFLADDGGLRAILGTVTVKLHQDTLRQLIEARIASSDLDPADKRRWSDALRELPAESIKHLTTKLIDMALDTAPGALPLLARFLGM